MSNIRFVTLTAIILAAAATRLIPHPPNVGPMTAIALLGGATFKDRRFAYLVPLSAMFLSDLLIGFHHLIPIVYGCLLFNVYLGSRIGKKNSLFLPVGASFLGSIIFFVTTNFGVWLIDFLYPRTLAGLESCFVAALPFFRNTVLGDVGYTVVLFGLFSLIEAKFQVLRESAA